MKPLRIALVSAYPPSRRPLSEYAWHLVQSLQASARVERVHVLADRGPYDIAASDGRVTVHRCWNFDGIDQPLRVVRAARRLKVDAIWFNLHLTSAGNTRVSWFAGLSAPAVARCAGLTTIVIPQHARPHGCAMGAAGDQSRGYSRGPHRDDPAAARRRIALAVAFARTCRPGLKELDAWGDTCGLFAAC